MMADALVIKSKNRGGKTKQKRGLKKTASWTEVNEPHWGTARTQPQAKEETKFRKAQILFTHRKKEGA